MQQDAAVEQLEARAVIEVPQVGELVAQRVDETRVLQDPTRPDVPQPNPDGSVLVADAVTAFDVRPLGRERAKLQPEAGREDTRIAPQSLQNPLLLCSLRLGKTPSRHAVWLPGGPEVYPGVGDQPA